MNDGTRLTNPFAGAAFEGAEEAFGFSPNEFDVRRQNGFRAGLQSSLTEGTPGQNPETETERTEAMARIADMLAEGLTGEAWDAYVVTLPNGRRVRLGEIKQAVDAINTDFDDFIADAQAAGVLPKDMSAADKDRLRGEAATLGAELEDARNGGNGVSRRRLEGMSPELTDLVGWQQQGRPSRAPSADAAVHASPPQAAPAPGL